MILRRLKIKWQVFRGKAIDIWSKDPYPSNVLSNLCSNGFKFDGMLCGSMEGFLHSLKQKDINKQRQICSMKGKNAKKMTTNAWQCDQIVWWKGNAIDRQSEDFIKLVRAAYQCMFEQSERFRMALMETRGMTLYHSRGESNPYKTILTEQEFCGVLAEIRDSYDMREKIVPKFRICESEDSGTGDRSVSRRATRCSIYQDINLFPVPTGIRRVQPHGHRPSGDGGHR